MGITFTTDMGPIAEYVIEDWAGNEERGFTSSAAAQMRVNALNVTGDVLNGVTLSDDPYEAEDQHRFLVVPVPVHPVPEVQVSSENAALICAALNVAVWDAEPLAPKAFLYLVNAVGPIEADPGVPAHRLPGRMNWIEGGRRPGYLESQLGRLRTLAKFAIEHEREYISWG